MTVCDIVIRLLAALVLGGIIGYERQVRSKAAGLRTHILVSMGACLYMMVSLSIPTEMQAAYGMSSDGGRIAAQVVSGIGFLGAGTILAAQSTKRSSASRRRRASGPWRQSVSRRARASSSWQGSRRF